MGMFIKKSNYLQIFIGVVALCIGTLVYLASRSPEATYFVSQLPPFLSLHGRWPDLFGPAHKSLASFLHVFSFSMMTAGIAAESKTGLFAVCFGWAVVNLGFELGQYFDDRVVKHLPAWFEHYPLLETVDDYFTAGCFDGWDIAAIFAGSAAAYVVGTILEH